MDKQTPKVSIGMPVFNMEDTVQEAIDTILNQTLTDFELIICDNASEDGTGDICRAAAKNDSRIIYRRNPENIIGENFRLTFLLSKGKYFMWAAADDSRRPEMVAMCAEVLDADPDVALAYTYTEMIDPETDRRSINYDPFRLDQDDPAERYISLISSLELGNIVYGLYRRNVLYAIPPMAGTSHQSIIFSDAIFLMNLVLYGKVVQIPEALFIRRRGKSNPWHENLAKAERNSKNYLSKGITLPTSESIQEHVRQLLGSTLPVETKLQVIQKTYEIYVKRFGNFLSFEIDRAVKLAKEGKFTETWNGMPEAHPDTEIQNRIDQIYAGLLLERLERTSNFIHNHQGLHIGKAYCLGKMGRKREAELQIELATQLARHTATSK